MLKIINSILIVSVLLLGYQVVYLTESNTQLRDFCKIVETKELPKLYCLDTCVTHDMNTIFKRLDQLENKGVR